MWILKQTNCSQLLRLSLYNNLEYLWGDNAFVAAKPADGYLFENFTANTYLGAFIETSGGWDQHNTNTKLYKSLELRCNDEDKCTYDIIITGNFVKKN